MDKATPDSQQKNRSFETKLSRWLGNISDNYGPVSMICWEKSMLLTLLPIPEP